MFINFFLFLASVVGEPKTYSFTESDEPVFLSPAVGLGKGRIFGSVQNATSHVFFVLSEPQLDSWKLLSQFLEIHDRISTFTSRIDSDNFEFSVDLETNIQKYYVGVFFVKNPEKISGKLNLDWIQSDGTFLQYQYIPLASVLHSVLSLVIAFAAWYLFQYVFQAYKACTKLHLFYMGVFLFTVAFISAWIDSLDIEAVTGARNSWKTKWAPSLYQKGFDVLEVLMYLLTALGWQSMRESLSEKEVQYITVGTILSLILGILEIHCDGDEMQCGGYTSTRMVIHMFGFLTTIVAFNYHLAFLTANVNEGSIAASQTGFLYVKLNQFWWFRAIFLAFIIQPTVAVVIRTDILGWEDDWIFIAFFWVTKIALLAALALAFRPGKTNLKIVQLAMQERRR